MSEQRDDTSLDATISYLLDELWKARCIDQADQLRDNGFEKWRQDLKKATFLDARLTVQGELA